MSQIFFRVFIRFENTNLAWCRAGVGSVGLGRYKNWFKKKFQNKNNFQNGSKKVIAKPYTPYIPYTRLLKFAKPYTFWFFFEDFCQTLHLFQKMGQTLHLILKNHETLHPFTILPQTLHLLNFLSKTLHTLHLHEIWNNSDINFFTISITCIWRLGLH
jgi:hypothetical protein